MSSQGRRGGRPSKLTPEIQAAICKSLLSGNYRGPSARAAGISIVTMISWMKLGKKFPDGEYGKFLKAVQEAETVAETVQVDRLYKAGLEDPKFILEWLKRKFPQRWGQDRLDVKELRDLIGKLENRLNELQGHQVTPEA